MNLSTRAIVRTGDQVLIGGLIITGTAVKPVLIRAEGPSLITQGISGVLANPLLQLFDINGNLIAQNDNWKDSQQADIEATGIPPTNDAESAVLVFLPPSSYTAVVSGVNGATGIGLIEFFDLNPTGDSQLANMSTRGFVGTGDDVLIGGLIVGNGASTTVVLRALGPSLVNAGVVGALQDPTLELRDANGVLIAFDDNWRDSQETEIEATGLAPTDDRESAILRSIVAGGYTVIVRGVNNTTGLGLVEAYNIQ